MKVPGFRSTRKRGLFDVIGNQNPGIVLNFLNIVLK